MSFVDGNNGMFMPVAPAGGNGFGGFGGDGGWWVILFLFALMGNWGNGFGGNNDVIPYLLNQQTQGEVARGFDTSAISGQISGVQQSVNDLLIAGMNQNFALQSQFANCCCENRLAIANLSSDIAREACADRQTVSDGVQRILDQMCQDKIDAKNERIADLERQLTMATLAASQGQQTAQILADNAAQTVALEQYLNPTPRPAYVVANPNCCQQNNGCGCGFYN
jgi:hypothetical protein